MLIHGLQKMTLLDYPGKIACTVFLGGCDFRCPYCHNYELVDGSSNALLDDREFFSFLSTRKGLLDAVAITGGEPLMRKDLASFIKEIRSMGFAVKLDTNGYHPEQLKELLDQQLLSYVAMDIKNSLSKYSITTGIDNPDLSAIKASISLLLSSDIDYEFRTTVVKELHELSDFAEIGKLIRGAKAYYLQQFTPRDTVPDKALTSPDEEDMKGYLEEVKKYVPCAQLRGL
jgi:pyruvate formate lyase activating enzyme